jgi:hypothetical protein
VATYKVLGQSNPAATTETTLYTVGSASGAVVSSIVICNQAASAATYRIAVRPSADSVTAAKHWVVYGATVAASDSTVLTIGVTMAQSDKIQVYASSANVSFNAYGSEL